MAPLEEKRTLVTSGTGTSRIHSIASSRPFTQQIDVLFPSNSGLEDALRGLDFTYQTCASSLSDFLEFAKPYAQESKVSALGASTDDDGDVWCLDPRGILTLVVGKQTYQTLGIAGEPLPWKECCDTHVIRICVNKRTQFGAFKRWPTYGIKEAEALRRWDEHRGPWKITYSIKDADSTIHAGGVSQKLHANIMKRTNTYIPNVTADTLMLQENDEDPLEDWEESVSEMFEWVGMAALGSQRLSAGDRCDPYISVYAPPDPSQVGDLTVIGWTGLITSEFLSQVVETILSPNVASPSFVSVTAHAVPTSPVTYIPDDPLKAHPSLRAPHVDAEDTISVVYMREEGAAGQAGCSWLLAESMGRWDKRRG